jgi:DNA-binding response OmpR family regulator
METVLVVEDSRPMQRTLQRLFEADGLAVEIAGDGVVGLESFRRQTPSVVVLDLKLPRMPGKEVCRAFKAHAALVPVVVLSASAPRSYWRGYDARCAEPGNSQKAPHPRFLALAMKHWLSAKI